MSRRLLVDKIRSGTVIDHIEAGRALDVLRILGISGKEGFLVAVVMNVDSKKLGKKDIVKVEGLELSREQVDLIALISPRATINIVRDYEVVTKYRVTVPSRVRGLLRCVNPNCITNQPREPLETSFTVRGPEPLVLVCDYCGSRLTRDDVVRQLVGPGV